MTHSLAGAALAKAGLDRPTPLATATLVLAANAPDVDILSYVHGPYFALSFRRGVTHGVPALVVLPLVVAGAVLAWDRWVRRRRRPDAEPARPGAVLALAFVGCLTHPALDWMNSYGMRWGLPFDPRWSYGDSLFIIDPWLWLALGGAVFLGGTWRAGAQFGWILLAGALTALVLAAPVPAGAKALWSAALVLLAGLRALRRPVGEAGRRIVALSLALAALSYASGMLLSSSLARREARIAAREAGLATVDALMVAPVPADPLGGEVVVRTPDGYVRGTHRWTRAPRVLLGRDTVPLRAGAPGVTVTEVERAVAAAVHQPDVRRYLAWSRFPYYRVAPDGEGYRVLVTDARYDGRGAGSLGGVEVYVEAGRPLP